LLSFPKGGGGGKGNSKRNYRCGIRGGESNGVVVSKKERNILEKKKLKTLPEPEKKTRKNGSDRRGVESGSKRAIMNLMEIPETVQN